MDPVACLEKLLTAIAEGDRDSAAEAAQDLADWIDGGGFMPTVDNLGEIAQDLAREYPNPLAKYIR